MPSTRQRPPQVLRGSGSASCVDILLAGRRPPSLTDQSFSTLLLCSADFPEHRAKQPYRRSDFSPALDHLPRSPRGIQGAAPATPRFGFPSIVGRTLGRRRWGRVHRDSGALRADAPPSIATIGTRRPSQRTEVKHEHLSTLRCSRLHSNGPGNARRCLPTTTGGYRDMPASGWRGSNHRNVKMAKISEAMERLEVAIGI